MNREELTALIQNDELQPKWLFFWGHTPPKDGSISKTCFSQWWQGHSFEVEGDNYLTAEHYMMARKAKLFGDNEMLAKILQCNHPSEAKKLGRQVKNFDPKVWGQECIEIVVQGNVAKFSQHPELNEFLMNTGERILVEASPRDLIWGIGLGKDNPKAREPWNWRGQNLLGFALMEVRSRLA